jgi:hypothetical protein
MQERYYDRDEMAKREAYTQESMMAQGTRLGASVAGRELPMTEVMTRLSQTIGMMDDAIGELEQRTQVLRQMRPMGSTKDPRPEQCYSPLVGSLNDQNNRLERLLLSIRMITQELEI